MTKKPTFFLHETAHLSFKANEDERIFSLGSVRSFLVVRGSVRSFLVVRGSVRSFLAVRGSVRSAKSIIPYIH